MSNASKTQRILKFVIPSAIGALLFMLPVPVEGGLTIPLAILVNKFNDLVKPALPVIALAVISVSGILSLVTKLFKPGFIMNNAHWKGIFDTSLVWTFFRVLGAVFVVMVFFKRGPEMVISEATGTFVLYDLVALIMAIVVFAGGLLPLLIEFGLLEFVGTYLSKIFRKVFTLPGRAAVDCVTSWFGDTQVAVLLTTKQYEKGYYSEREAVVIATTFSAVSIAFSLVVIEQVGLGNMFIPFYLTVCVVGAICAVILPRIPPLSLRKDKWYTKSDAPAELIPEGYTLSKWALKCAVDKANSGYTFKRFSGDFLKTVTQISFSVFPIVMGVATCALIVSNYTPVLGWLGTPFMPLLNLLGLPEAEAASKTMVVGFTDMFLPAVIASESISSTLTKFVVATVSITQLIFLAENGSMILASKIPVNIGELFLIFLERTIVSIIVTTLVARFILQLV